MKREIILPDCLNASEFMWHVTTNTPQILRQVNGIVNVDACLHIDASGKVTIKSVTCRTVTGRQVAADNAEIIAAARAALSIMRFTPAYDNGTAIPYDDYSLSIGYTTAALETRASPADRIVSQRLKN